MKHAWLAIFNGLVAILAYTIGPWQPHWVWAMLVVGNVAFAAVNGVLAITERRDPELEELRRGQR